MAMTTITPASFTRLISTAPDALAIRTFESEFRTNTVTCGLVVALFATAQALAEASEIKAPLRVQNTFCVQSRLLARETGPIMSIRQLSDVIQE